MFSSACQRGVLSLAGRGNSELLVNGNFANGTTNWYFTDSSGGASTPSMGVVTAKQLTVTGVGTPRASDAIDGSTPVFQFVVGLTYDISVRILSATSSPFLAVATAADITSVQAQDGAGSNTARIAALTWTATVAVAWVGLRSAAAGSFTISDFSVKPRF